MKKFSGLLLTAIFTIASVSVFTGIALSTENTNDADNDPDCKFFKEFKPPEHIFKEFSKHLGLTNEQQKKFQDLKEQGKAHGDIMKQKMDSSKAVVDQIFLTDNFDLDEIKEKLEKLKPESDTESKFMANQILSGWNILKDEQRKKIAELIVERGPRPLPLPPKLPREFFDKISAELKLTKEQFSIIKTLHKVPPPPPEHEIFARRASEEIINELNSGKATIDSLKVILKLFAPKHEDRMIKDLERLQIIHPILDSSQRKKFLEFVSKMPPPFPHPPGPGPFGLFF